MPDKRPVVFLGTPAAAVVVLDALVDAAQFCEVALADGEGGGGAEDRPFVAVERQITAGVGGLDHQRVQGAEGDTAPGPPVRMSTPSAVTRIVCSNCAVRFRSRVTAVQPSGHIS